jgi:hypothetical protein
MLFWQVLAQDLGRLCDTSTTRDIQTVSSRFKDEGLSFLTITLSNFARDLQKGLELGYVDHTLFTGFRFGAGLPLFLGGFLDRIFDRKTGRLLDEPSSDCIFAIRQLTLLYSKILIDCTETRNRRAKVGFLKCEKELKSWDKSFNSDESLQQQFLRMSRLLYADMFSSLDHMVYEGNIIPKHGPGSTADRKKGNAKYIQTTWPLRLEDAFSYTDYALPNYRYHTMVDRVKFLEPGAEIPVKVTLVPKTLKTPRIIAIEPTAMQYAQQGLLERFVECLEHGSFLTRGMIGILDQTPNQRMAMEGSLTQELATLDLSEASDRVSNQLVLTMMQDFPWLSQAVQASRSRRAKMDNEVIRLSKFASMGSALCFPVEAMVFLAVVMIGIQNKLNRQLTKKDVQFLRGRVRIYGDDIIVPVEYVSSVVSALETFGFLVNTGKSFWNGRFRESCGKDYYNGDDVSVIKCRQVFPTSQRNASEIVSAVSLRNQLYAAGLWDTARHLDGQLSHLLGYFPAVLPTSPALGRLSFLGFDTEKMDEHLHRPLVKAWTISAPTPKSNLDGVDALQKWFLKRGEEPFADADHLERFGRPEAVYIKLRHVSST